MRANALTVIHKVIRRELFDLSAQISSAGPADIATVRESLRAVTELLNAHAAHEEAGFEPRIRERNAAFAARLVNDHHRLHGELDAVREAAERFDPAQPGAAAALVQMHLDWNRFVGGYLLHLDDEERRLFVDLGEVIPPVEFMAEAVTSMGGKEGAAFLEKLWKVVTPGERETIERALPA